MSFAHKQCLSPISGSLDRSDSVPDISERVSNVGKSTLLYDNASDRFRSSSVSATNELPLTELNLDLFTSEKDYDYLQNDSLASSTNELPLSNLKFQHNNETSSCFDEVVKSSRSFSDPNILPLNENTINLDESQKDLNYFPPFDSTRFSSDNVLKTHEIKTYHLSPLNIPIFPNSFYPTELNMNNNILNAPPSRSASQPAQLYFNANTLISSHHPARSISQPDNLTSAESLDKRGPSPNIVTRSPVHPESSTGVKRHRHSIAGQMSYIKMLGFGFGGPIGLKKMTGGSNNSLFSTAVISGSSSAPNLRDMIPNSASATGIFVFIYLNIIYVIIIK